MTRVRLTAAAGFTLVEVMVTMLVLASGLGATFRVLTAANHANVSAQRNEAAISVAQREMEMLRSLEYTELGMTGLSTDADNPSLCWNNTGTLSTLPCVRADTVAGCPILQARGEIAATPAAAAEPLVLPAASTACVSDESTAGAADYRVAPFRTVEVPLGGSDVTMRVWHYVSWRNESCDGGNCGGSTGYQDTKRISVAVVPDKGTGPGLPPKAVWMTSVAVNPEAHTDDVDLAGPPPAPKLQSNKYFLYDRYCNGVVESNSHDTHNTSKTGSSCGSDLNAIGRPDLMGADAPTATGSIGNFSAEAGNPSPGGLKLNTSGGNCPTPTDYSDSADKNTMHTWVTPPLASYTRIKSKIVFDFWALNASDLDADEHLCVSLSSRNGNGDNTDSSRVALAAAKSGECTRSVPPISSEPTRFTCLFTLTPASGAAGGADGEDGALFRNIDAGRRLALTVSVESDADSQPMFLMYDHSDHSSSLQFQTCTSPVVGGDTCSQP